MSDLLRMSNLTKEQIQRRIDQIEFTLANDDQWSLEFERSMYLVELKGVYRMLIQILDMLPK